MTLQTLPPTQFTTMQILSKSAHDTPVLISNAEVLELLQKRIEDREGIDADNMLKGKKYQHRDWIESHVVSFLQTTPCVRLDEREELRQQLIMSSRKRRTASGTETVAEGDGGGAEAGFGLTEAEALQILNYLPQEPVEIHLMIEELNSRLSESRQEELLKLIRLYDSQGQNDEATKNEGGTEAEPSVASAEGIEVVEEDALEMGEEETEDEADKTVVKEES